MRSAISLVGADLVGGGGGDVEDLAADRQDRLGLAVARLLGRAAGAVAFDDEQFGARGIVIGAVGELAGQAQLARAGRGLALDLALGAALAAARPSARATQPSSARPRSILSARIMVEMVAHRILDQPRRLGLVSRSLVWLWNCGSRMKTDSIISTPVITSSAVMSLAFFLPTSSPNARMPLVSAARRPASCVPPSGVGMVLQ